MVTFWRPSQRDTRISVSGSNCGGLSNPTCTQRRRIMAERVRIVDYYYVTSDDRPGEGAGVLSALKSARVNLLAVHAFPEGQRIQVDLVPSNPEALVKAARKAKLKLSRKKKAFLVTGDDKGGALTPILNQLAEAKVNVTALTALTGGSKRFGAIFWVNPRDMGRASKALGIK